MRAFPVPPDQLAILSLAGYHVWSMSRTEYTFLMLTHYPVLLDFHYLRGSPGDADAATSTTHGRTPLSIGLP